MHSSMKFMLLSVFLDYSCSNSTCNLPKSYNPYPEVIGLESKEILEYYKNKEMLALDL